MEVNWQARVVARDEVSRAEKSFEDGLVRPSRGAMRKALEGSLRAWPADLKREAERGA